MPADAPETPDQAATDEQDGTVEPDEHVEPAELLTLRDGLPEITDTEAGLAEVCARVAAGTGPVALDAERASGYRYSNRAYLVQLRREGSGSALVDPIAFTSMAPLAEAIGDAEWILHAASQDLPCLADIGLRPASLFDTELAGRLLGYPRVGLATLVETLLGYRLKKEHSAVDWSTRPLPRPWLEYAALDVEVLLELREVLLAELVEQGKDGWARQEFDHLLGFEPTVRQEAWRRTGGLHRVRGRRNLAAVRELWETRDELAERRDVTPGRIVPDAAIIAAATAQPTDRDSLMRTPGFHGRGADRYAARWVEALQRAAAMSEDELPARTQRTDGPPTARAWAERDPVAAARLRLAREELATLSTEQRVPAENLLTPDFLRRTLWTPPETREPGELLDEVVARLTEYGARSWQSALVAPVLVRAILQADVEAAADPAGEDEPAPPVQDS
ncbi:Ribonuclease D [Nocardioides aquaticus]|uniref:Ribonuclease D n=1 Tax=Nocardioides aquaticus TaxID=160826 RepID=A0ABX8EQ15_9ACTN|nr:HRDC domain-containing protein [Nocardioides aquaticus]QVT81413.1 Ribonuclease D [Nocardioides aquaticus]